MTRPRLVLLALVAALLGACSDLTPWAAQVNGEKITESQLRRELNAILDNKAFLERVDQGFSGGGERVRGEGDNTFNTVFVAAVLDRRIGFALIHQEVVRRKLAVTDAVRKDTRAQLEENYTKKVFDAFPKAYREELVTVFSEQAVLGKALPRSSVTDKAVADFYEQNRPAFDRTCVRHILVADEAKAKTIKARLDAGEDFAAIASAESTDNQVSGGSAQKGGDLGCVAKGNLVPEFEAAMDALQPGQVSEPVQTQFGWHVIQVMERKAETLAEATDEIRQVLERQQPDPVGQYVTKALDKARIKVNPRYGVFVKGPNPGVRAPKLLDAASTTSVPLPTP